MLRLLKSKLFIFIFLTISLLVVVGISYNPSHKVNWVNNIISVPLTPVQKFFSFVGQKVEGGLSLFQDAAALKKENESLKSDMERLQKENRDLLRAREENKELREVLKLKDQFNNYESMGANVIARDMGNWFSTFKIDRGTKDGIIMKDNAGTVNYYPVISSMGLVGRVISSDVFSSKVVSIIDVNSSISAIISRTRDSVLVKGDLILKDQGLCKMDYIPNDADISVGDKVETSGTGGVFPKGILIGKVVQIKQTASELNRYAVIEPAVDFKRLEEVFVLINKNTEAGSIKK